MTTENFIVHPDTGANQQTDADILAVRFHHRSENFTNPMVDHEKVSKCETLINVVIAEVKTGQCMLNGPWTDRGAGNMERVLRSIGVFEEEFVRKASDSLYEFGIFKNNTSTVRLFAVGQRFNSDIMIDHHQQLTWDEIINFLCERFRSYRRQKSSVPQWSEDGIQLRQAALTNNHRKIRTLFTLPNS